MTLQDYIDKNLAKNVIDHSLRAGIDNEGKTTFYIHPLGVDGDTPDFIVIGNVVENVADAKAQEAS